MVMSAVRGIALPTFPSFIRGYGEDLKYYVITCHGGCSAATFYDGSLVICLPPDGYGSCFGAKILSLPQWLLS
jgi:hypothetical protein